MIKVFLSKDKINQILLRDYEKYVFDEIIALKNKSELLDFTEIIELINSKEKCIDLVLLDSRVKLFNFYDKYNNILSRIEARIGIKKLENGKKIIRDEFINIYKKFSGRKVAYDLLKEMNIRVCPYCNRMYTFSVRSKNGKIKTRPEFDHYIPKEKCPLLAVSIYNLIPSCSICNKGKSKSMPNHILYPYESSFEDKGIYFELQDIMYILLDKPTEKQIVKLKSEQASSNDIIDTYNSVFKIEELYNEHRDYIIDLIKKKQIYSEELIDSIFQSFKELFDSSEEVRELLLGCVLDDDYTQRPLSKLTNDILSQL